MRPLPPWPRQPGKKVAIIGSGPGGIVAAADARRAGHDVTVFEAFHKPGGVMVYGIPEFRLPKAIVQKELETLKKMGVKIVTNFIVGRTRTIEQLMKEDGFDAVYIGVGAGLAQLHGHRGRIARRRLQRQRVPDAGQPDEGLRLRQRRRHADRGLQTGGRGRRRQRRDGFGPDGRAAGGREGLPDLPPDRSRKCPPGSRKSTTPRKKASNSTCSRTPSASSATQAASVTAIECLRYELGEPDASGRRRPVAIAGSEFQIEVDTVIIAIGNLANPLIRQTTPGLEFNK